MEITEEQVDEVLRSMLVLGEIECWLDKDTDEWVYGLKEG